MLWCDAMHPNGHLPLEAKPTRHNCHLVVQIDLGDQALYVVPFSGVVRDGRLNHWNWLMMIRVYTLLDGANFHAHHNRKAKVLFACRLTWQNALQACMLNACKLLGFPLNV